MTREEALQRIVDNNFAGEYGLDLQILIDCTAVARKIILDSQFPNKALEQDTVPFDFELYQAGLMDMPKGTIEVLDKIRAEIIDTGAYEQEVNGKTEFLKGINYCLGVIDKHKAESEDIE